MAHGDLALAHVFHDLGSKDLADKSHVLVACDDAIVIDGHTCALLPPVLQGKEGAVNGGGGAALRIGAVKTKYAAFFMDV